MSILNDLNKLCFNLNKTNQTKEKVAILQSLKNNLMIDILLYTYDPAIVFKITSKNIKKFISLKRNDEIIENIPDDDLFFVLNQLKNGVWSGNTALRNISFFLRNKSDHEKSVFYNIIDKNLKIRISLTTLQKLFPEKFPDFAVVLANSYIPSKSIIDESWYISRKLDGIRCLVFVNCDNQQIDIYSRNKKPIMTLNLLKEELKDGMRRGVFCSLGSSFILDGEIVDCFDKNNFKSVMENINKKNHTMEHFEYRIFDCISKCQFKKQMTKILIYFLFDTIESK